MDINGDPLTRETVRGRSREGFKLRGGGVGEETISRGPSKPTTEKRGEIRWLNYMLRQHVNRFLTTFESAYREYREFDYGERSHLARRKWGD